MFKSILVAVDGSVQGGVAIRHAMDFATRFHATLTGLHVVDAKILEAPYLTDLAGMTGAVPFTGLMSDVRLSLERRGREVLDAFQRTCEEAGIRASTTIETGIIPKVIAQVSMGHDLLCMGRKAGGAEWVGHLLGSTVESTLRRVHVPVLLGGESHREVKRILVAFDGSAFANAALRVAIQFLEASEGECVLLAVGPYEDEAAGLLEDARKLLRSHQISYSEAIRAGDPREQIVLVAREVSADLVAMGAFGHSRIREVLLGSTTDGVMRACPLPLLIARG